MDSEYGFVFSNPVDPVRLNLPDYHQASPLSFSGYSWSGSIHLLRCYSIPHRALISMD